MSTFAQISAEFDRMIFRIRKKTRKTLEEESKRILADLISRSPRDSGHFLENWKITVPRFTPWLRVASISIKNDVPYAYFMEYGATPGKAPWYYPQRNKQGRFKKGTGKLKASGGRIWAGGLSPGHDKTIGGAIGPALLKSEKRLNQLTKSIADAVITSMQK